jgi:hypothetical protein
MISVYLNRGSLVKIQEAAQYRKINLEKAEKLEYYPLYGTMKKISAAIFEWEPSDIEVLRKAK